MTDKTRLLTTDIEKRLRYLLLPCMPKGCTPFTVEAITNNGNFYKEENELMDKILPEIESFINKWSKL